MKQNIEFKAYCSDPDRIPLVVSEFGAKHSHSADQVDTYLHIPSRRLKIRSSDGQRLLIVYTRQDTPRPRESRFDIADIRGVGPDFKRVMTRALGVRTVVRKRRDVFVGNDFLINVDDVSGLGKFVEVEVDATEVGKFQAQQLAEKIKRSLRVTLPEVLPWSYAELQLMLRHASKWRTRLAGLKKRGTLFLFDGASASGKSTLAFHLATDPTFSALFIPRCCTRRRRHMERVWSECDFVTRGEFLELAWNGGFLEYRDFEFGMSYGLAWRSAMPALVRGVNAFSIMNLGNVLHIKRIFPEAVTVLVDAPLSSLRRRLLARGVHDEGQIQERLDNAKAIDAYRKYYDYTIENRDGKLEQALRKARHIISADREFKSRE